MRDLESTPIIKYDGPPELRKGLEMEGRKFLGYVNGAFGGGNPYQKFTKQFPDGTVIEVQSIHNIPDTPGVDTIVIFVPQQGGKKKKKKGVRREEKQQVRFLVGLEYTDGSCGTREGGSFENYTGYGMSVNVLTEKGMSPVVSIPWEESVPLKGPWKMQFASGDNAIKGGTPSSPYPGPAVPYQHYYDYAIASKREQYSQFNAKAQGDEVGPYNFILGPDTRVELMQLYEMDYSSALYPSLMRKGERCIAIGASPSQIEHYEKYEWHYTTWIEVAGKIIAGPFTRVSGTYTRIQVKNELNHHRGQEDNYEYGEEIRDFAGMVLDENTYICLYSKFAYNNCNRYCESEKCPGTGPIAADQSNLTVDTYSGSFEEYPYICCSGTTYAINRDKGVWSAPWGSEGTTGMIARCVRIFGFGKEIPDDPSQLFYLYSFWEPQFNPPGEDDSYTIDPVLCRYGYVTGTTNILAEEGYPTIIGTDNYYSHDNNTVPGMPMQDNGEPYRSSILMRVYKETITTEEEFETEEAE